MAAHEVTCATYTGCASGGHVAAIGVAGPIRLRVQEAYRWIDRGETFFTSDDAGNLALVDKHRCACGQCTLRTAPDHTAGDHMAALPSC